MQERRFRLITVSDELHGHGGACVVQASVAESLAQRGHAVELLFLNDGPYRTRWQGFTDELHRLPQLNEPKVEDLPSRVRNLASVAANTAVGSAVGLWRRRSVPSVVYANAHGDLMAASTLARATSSPVVLHLHSPPWDLRKLGRRKQRAFGSAAAYIFVSDALRQAWTEVGIDPDRSHVVHNGVDSDHYSPSVTLAPGIETSERPFVVGYVGRIEAIKGVHVLAQAMRSEGLRDARLRVMGFAEEAQRSEYERGLIDEFGSSFEAVTSGSATRDFYRGCDVVVVPSIYPDPFPLVILEAMACGVPVVTTRVGGCLEGLSPRLRELAAEPDDVEALARSIEQVRLDRRASSTLGDGDRAHILSHHTDGLMVDRLIEVFETALDR